jgi:membrane-associated HD superfamily phosphohydrolase
MLADSCESAARVLQVPTPERVRHLIDAIVDAKISEGQLDDAPLTLREIALVKDQFATMLSGIAHRRIEYPETKHLTEQLTEVGSGVVRAGK